MFHTTRYLVCNPILSGGRFMNRTRYYSTLLVNNHKRYAKHICCTSSSKNVHTNVNTSSSFSTFSRIVKSPSLSQQQRLLSNNAKNNSKNTSSSSSETTTFLQRWMAHKEIPPRGTLKWYGEMTLICTVFAITGTSTMFLVRPAMSEVLGLKGSFKDGPWSYRICSIVIMTPLYSALLVMVGTVFGRHRYFRHFAVKMFSRFGIPPELMDKTFHETAKNFRKY